MFNDIDLEQIDLSGEAPEQEPQRQYYYIAKLRNAVSEASMAAGKKLSACVKTFGCQMNAKDSEKLTGILEIVGYEMTENEEADFVLYNTCTVRENANLKVYGHLGLLSSMKKKNPKKVICLCGCMMQEPEVVEKIRTSYRFVDLIFGTHNIYKFAELLYTVYESRKTVELAPKKNDKKDKKSAGMVIDLWKDTDRIVEDLPAERTYSFKSGVNIMFGCNNFCSYCIVPYVRGRERSRKPEDILKEIRDLVADGVNEVMLLGQNVNSYGKNLEEPMTFAELLRKVEQIEGLERIRFMTSHPKDLSDELIEVMRDSKKICRHLHLPLQSGSTEILKKMNRRYTKEQYLDLAARLRKEMPDLAITTDIIVGFPGETEEDFLETLDVVRKVKYDSAFTFIYSKRTGTPAAAMENQVPEDVVKDRFNRLLEVVGEISKEMSAKVEGKVMEALVESVNEHDPNLVTGRLSNNLLVHFPGGPELIGKLVNVHMKECKGFYYIGERV